MGSQPRIDPRLAQRLHDKHTALNQRRPLSPGTLMRLHEDLQVRLTFHSNALEGNTLSLRETQMVIEHGITIGGHTLREHLEATNHAAAFRFLLDLARDTAPLTLDAVLELHRLVTVGIVDQAGMFRPGAVSIRGSQLQPPPAREVPELMAQWLAWIYGEGQGYQPVMRAIIAHHGFVAVHPFVDGNGRTGRLLLNLLLMHSAFPPALLLSEWRLGYLEGLAQADRGRYGPLLNLIGRAVEAGLDLYLDASDTTGEDDWRPLAELAPGTAYSAEYLALLIRKGRLEGSKRGRRWHSTPQAIARYADEVASREVPRGRPPISLSTRD